MPNDVHRKSEIARLVTLLEGKDPGLRIAGVSGPGGVGKSFLLRHVLDDLAADGRTFLKLTVDGSNEQVRSDLFGLLDGQLARSSLPPPAKPKHDYFPRLRKVASIHRLLLEAVATELDANAAPPEIKSIALELLKAGRRLNKAIPKTRGYFDAASAKDADVTSTVDEAWKVVVGLRALRDSGALPGPVHELLGTTYKARVKNDLYNVTADALLADLSAALGVRSTRLGFAPPSIPGAERVLIIVDDFEALAPVLEELLVGALIPRLADAPFPTTLILLGRDDLEAMHPAWAQHCRQYIRDQIRLAPFGRDDAIDMLTRAGVPASRHADLFEATQGFPFLLGLLIEELGAEGDSALFLRTFFDRTTRWMSAREREWFVRVSYLDSVNVDTLAVLFPGEDVEPIQDWFEREASIRDPAASVFRVRPLIREKVLRYLELRSPSRHREMTERARIATS